MKVAIVHDWLTVFAGAERVLEQVLHLFPEADLFSTIDFFEDAQRVHLLQKKAQTTFIQRLPFAKKMYRHYYPLMPFAIEQLDLTSYDLVISSAFSIAKGVITSPSQLHICYCHSPGRYLWDLQFQYLQESGFTKGLKGALLGIVARYFLYKMRNWDYRSAQGVDHFIANSAFIAKRIQKCYRRESTVIYPPVDVEAFPFLEKKEDFYFTASRLVPYKKIKSIVEAFCQMPDKKLIVLGEGPDWKELNKLVAKNKKGNVKLLQYGDRIVLKSYMQKAKAFVFAAIEDFGITPIEALACGTPVIAFNQGGVAETVQGLDTAVPTGCFFDSQTAEGVIKGVKEFEKWGKKILPKKCREAALAFSNHNFRNNLRFFIEEKLKTHRM